MYYKILITNDINIRPAFFILSDDAKGFYKKTS
jgi:hypothetical protein